MKRILFIMLALVLAIGLAPTVLANPSSYDGSIDWKGQGSGSLRCDMVDDDPDDPRTEDGWIHWVLTQAKNVTESKLVLSGSGSGMYEPTKVTPGGTIHFYTLYFDLGTLNATVHYKGSLGKNPQFVISDYCPGDGVVEPREVLTVTKTAVTSYVRFHEWSVDKSVDTENGYEHGGYPKIWLYVDGRGDETATWTIDVTYKGYEDGEFNVSGNITIENTGDLDAVITEVEDLLAGTEIDVHFEVDFPFTLRVGETLVGTYTADVEDRVEGYNMVTVTTERFDYVAYAEIVWGEPDYEVDGGVEVLDYSDIFGEQSLGQLDARDYKAGDVIPFTYEKKFKWADYGASKCGEYTYENQVELEGSFGSIIDFAEATLKVNVQCYIYETAYAKAATNSSCFIPTFGNWGWTNQIGPGTYTWDLWAAAGQCDTSKGIKVGTVTVVYDAITGTVTVTYNVAFPYKLEETHVYAGTTMFPQVKVGNKRVSTVAPGQYYNAGPFTATPKPQVYVIAHAKVGIPDPNFGP